MVRRMIWFGLGAAAGYVVARRGERLVDEARERGVVGNVTLVAGSATKLAAGASKAVVSLGESAGSSVRQRAAGPAPTPSASPRPAPTPTASTARPS